MPVDEETETKTVENTRTWFGCDRKDCDEQTQWHNDMNHVVINPETRVAMTRSTKDKIGRDGLVMLCDDHLEEFVSFVEDFGVEFYDDHRIIVDPSFTPV